MSAGATFALRYGTGRIEVAPPAGRFDLLSASPPAALADPAAALRAAVEEPVAAPPLRAALRGGDRVTIVVSDGTRQTGIDALLPALLAYLDAAGVPAARVRVLFALGMHRRQTREEQARIVGAAVAARIALADHDCDDDAALETLTREGPAAGVRLNRQVLDGDLVIVTGGIGFHYLAGFGGGRKAILPGVAGRESVRDFHRRSLAIEPDGGRHLAIATGVRHGNPLDALATTAATALPRTFLVNTILTPGRDGRGGIAAVVAGDLAAAFDRGCAYHRNHFAAAIAARRPVVIVSAGGAPRDCDLVQTQKAIGAGAAALAPGGSMLVVAACPEGAGQSDLLRWFEYRDRGSHVAALRAAFTVPGQTALALREHAARARIHLYSTLPPDVVAAMGMVPVTGVEDFFAAVTRAHGADVEGWVLTEGARYLPVAAAA